MWKWKHREFEGTFFFFFFLVGRRLDIYLFLAPDKAFQARVDLPEALYLPSPVLYKALGSLPVLHCPLPASPLFLPNQTPHCSVL
jgi:hypothetical protein